VGIHQLFQQIEALTRMQTQSIWDPELNSYLAAALGSERWSSIQAALTRPPLSVCLRVNTLRSTLEVRGASL
jgi:16S rRNA C967 or C1407 C5-methylase (RsmB/RsmF family)